PPLSLLSFPTRRSSDLVRLRQLALLLREFPILPAGGAGFGGAGGIVVQPPEQISLLDVIVAALGPLRHLQGNHGDIRLDALRLEDRKSTRLNSSHVSIS